MLLIFLSLSLSPQLLKSSSLLSTHSRLTLDLFQMSSFLLPYILPYILPSTSTTLVLSHSSCVIKLHNLTLGGDGLTGQALDVLLKAWGKRCTTPTSSSSTTQPRQRGSGRGGRAWLNAEKVEVFLPDDVWQVRDGVCCVSNASLTANTPIILTHSIPFASV